MAYEFEKFGLQEMTEVGVAMRTVGEAKTTMEEVADALVRYLHTSFRDAGGEKACALVRLYKTHVYSELEPELKAFADECLPWGKPDAKTKCLTLLATAGDEEAWCDRKKSGGHKAIPLLSAEVVSRIPMIARLVHQFGAEVAEVVGEGGLMLDATQKSYNVFHVEDANGSPFIPAQDTFVVPYKIRSVLGFGGVLPSGNLFAMILFTKVHVSLETAELFKTLALNVKMALLRNERQVFR